MVKEGKEMRGLLLLLVYISIIKILFRFLSTNHSVPPGIIVRITSSSSSRTCSYVLEWKEEINRIFLNRF